MPTYQYACTEPECGHAFEEFQSFTDDALTVCPRCEGRLRKVFNAVGVVFKGSGFYRTDSRAGATSADGASSGSASSKEGSTGAKEGSSTETSSPTTKPLSPSKPSSTSSSSSASAGAGAA